MRRAEPGLEKADGLWSDQPGRALLVLAADCAPVALVRANGARYQQVVMSPVDAEIVSLSNLSDKQVAHMYELSAWELDAPSGDSNTYANVSEKRQDRVDGPLASWSARL